MDSIKAIASHFSFPGEYVASEHFGCGHINDTFAVTYKASGGSLKRYILQRINTSIFDPDKLMHNIVLVTDYLHKLIAERGGDPYRETLTIIPTCDGAYYYRDSEGNCFRAYIFIEDTIAYEAIESHEVFENTGLAFGLFQKDLADFPADSLYEIIPDFHNTAKRLNALKAAVKEDKAGRADSVREDIEFALSREADCSKVVDMLEEGRLPLRVTHNDTKLNNILIDRNTGKATCIVDLDTIMPGSILYDFGDSVRFGASTAAEDETDLSKVSCDLTLFESFAKGFLKATSDSITEEERDLLAFSCKLITLELGIRFLTDHLNGDTYFHIAHENHNLERARSQFKLVLDMEQKMDEMEAIIKNLA